MLSFLLLTRTVHCHVQGSIKASLGIVSKTVLETVTMSPCNCHSNSIPDGRCSSGDCFVSSFEPHKYSGQATSKSQSCSLFSIGCPHRKPSACYPQADPSTNFASDHCTSLAAVTAAIPNCSSHNHRTTSCHDLSDQSSNRGSFIDPTRSTSGAITQPKHCKNYLGTKPTSFCK